MIEYFLFIHETIILRHMSDAQPVSVLELRRLLIQLKESRPDICVRFRLIGKMWLKSFIRIVLVKNNEVLFNDEAQGKLIIVHQLSDIIQFEIDHAFQNFEPHFHYTVAYSSEPV